MILTWAASIIGAYLVGSIPFGVLIGRAKGVDIRQHGSKNIGATNVGRVLGKKFGLLCFALDVLKGAGPVAASGGVIGILGRPADEISFTAMWLWQAVAAATVLGHMYSIFLGFGGGKGVATGFGAVLGMWPLLTIPGLCALAVWFFTLRISRYVSLASMIGAITLPLAYLITVLATPGEGQMSGSGIERVLHASPPLVTTLILAALIVWRHRANIARLRRGEEPKITRK